MRGKRVGLVVAGTLLTGAAYVLNTQSGLTALEGRAGSNDQVTGGQQLEWRTAPPAPWGGRTKIAIATPLDRNGAGGSCVTNGVTTTCVQVFRNNSLSTAAPQIPPGWTPSP